jgi:hypothetical protein
MDDALKSALYLNASQRTITYKHKTQTISESFWQQNFVNVLYPLWDSDRDKLEVFSYSSTGDVLVVKNKYSKNFKTGEFYWSSYQFPVEEIPREEVDALYEKLVELYILFVSSNKNTYNDKLKAAYVGQSIVNWNKIRILRKFMLDESDWTLLPDSTVSDEEKEMWKLYRNTLRNIPQEQGDSNPYEVYFPISPDIYKKRGYKEPYLSKEVDLETKEYQYYQLTNNNLENYTQKIMNYIAICVSTFPLEDKDINVVSAPENTLEEMIRFIEENHMSSDWEEPQAIDSEDI